MPEGDAVWRTARELERLGADPLTVCDLRFPAVATVDLRGARAVSVGTYGKHLLHRFVLDGDGWTIHSHLRMEGLWRVRPTPRVAAAMTARHTIRAVLATDHMTAVGDLLGMLDVVATEREHELIGHLGPDILAPDANLDLAVANILSRPERPLVETLLDQTCVAGIGTIYACDPMFLHGLNPWRTVGDIGADRLRTLLDQTRSLMARNCTASVPTLTGRTGRGASTWVHRRAGQSCRRCPTRLVGTMSGPPGNERWIIYCPHCQAP